LGEIIIHMNIFEIVLVALSLALDAFAVSVTKGATDKNITVKYALAIAATFGIFQFFMPIIGWTLGKGFADIVSGLGNWVAFVLLSGVGLRMIYEALTHDAKEKIAEEKSIMRFSVLIMLAVVTSLDALVTGISFAFIPVHIWFVVLLIGLITFALSYIGIYLGKRLGTLMGDTFEVIGGAVLILLAIKILLW
jgi:manganese efflux pump family protein